MPQQQVQQVQQAPQAPQIQRADYAAGGVPREHEQNDIFRLLDNNNNIDRFNNIAVDDNNGYDANYMNVMYDEDDEMLARAIQESLNDGLY